MTRKKIICLLVVFAMLFSLLIAACKKEETTAPDDTQATASSDEEVLDDRPMEGNMYLTGFPIVKEKVTYTIGIYHGPENGDYNEVGVFPLLEEETNVKLQFNLIPSSGATERVSLELATGDYPDAYIRIGLLRDSGETWKHAKDGTFIALDEYIEKYCPNIKKVFEQYPLARISSTAPDGHIYSLPCVADTLVRDIRGVLFINKNWLDVVGKDVPTTTDEYYEALLAFSKTDCNQNNKEDEVPSSFVFDSGTMGYYDLSGAFGVYNLVGYCLAVRDGKVSYEPAREEYKNFLKYMRKLFADGCMDPESFTQDDNVYGSKFINENDEITIGSFISYTHSDWMPFERAQQEFVPVPVLKGPDGHQMWRRDPTGTVDAHLFHITDKCKDPQILMRVIDTLNTEKWAIMAQRGMENINWRINEKGKYEEINQDDPQLMADYFTCWKGPWSITRDIYSKFEMNEAQQARYSWTQLYAPYITSIENMFPPFAFFDPDDMETLGIILTDLTNYKNRMEANFIMEGNIDELWDEYIAELEKIGLDTMLGLTQKAIN